MFFTLLTCTQSEKRTYFFVERKHLSKEESPSNPSTAIFRNRKQLKDNNRRKTPYDMGCAEARYAYITHPRILEWKSDFDVLSLDEIIITRYHDMFLRIINREKNKKDTPSITTAVACLGFDGNKFMQRVFSMLDQEQNSQQISFHEFVIIIWNFCTLDEHLGTC